MELPLDAKNNDNGWLNCLYVCLFVVRFHSIIVYLITNYVCTYCVMQLTCKYPGWYIHTTCVLHTYIPMIIHAPHPVPSSCTLCQPVLIASTSDKKYRFGVPSRYLLSKIDSNLIMCSVSSYSREILTLRTVGP